MNKNSGTKQTTYLGNDLSQQNLQLSHIDDDSIFKEISPIPSLH